MNLTDVLYLAGQSDQCYYGGKLCSYIVDETGTYINVRYAGDNLLYLSDSGSCDYAFDQDQAYYITPHQEFEKYPTTGFTVLTQSDSSAIHLTSVEPAPPSFELAQMQFIFGYLGALTLGMFAGLLYDLAKGLRV